LRNMLIQGGIQEERIGLLIGSTKVADRDRMKARQIILSTAQLGREGLDIGTLNTEIIALPVGDITQLGGRLRTVMASGPNRAEFCQSVQTVHGCLHAVHRALPAQLWNLVADFAYSAEPPPMPVVLHMVDPYGAAEGMGWKTYQQYSKMGYVVQRPVV